METYNLSVPYRGQVHNVKLDFYYEDVDAAVVAHIVDEDILFIPNDMNQIKPASPVQNVDIGLVEAVGSSIAKG
jgi:hypothetical protein